METRQTNFLKTFWGSICSCGIFLWCGMVFVVISMACSVVSSTKEPKNQTIHQLTWIICKSHWMLLFQKKILQIVMKSNRGKNWFYNDIKCINNASYSKQIEHKIIHHKHYKIIIINSILNIEFIFFFFSKQKIIQKWKKLRSWSFWVRIDSECMRLVTDAYK